jgi:hypothetical protein
VSSVALTALHRAAPARSLPELEAAAQRRGPIQRAAAHVARCRSCRRLAWQRNVLCEVGATLAKRIPRPRRAQAR